MLTSAAASVLFTLVLVMAARGELNDHKPTADERFQQVARGLAPAVAFLASVPIAFLAAPDIARLFWLSLLVVNPAIPRLASRIRRSRNEP